MVKAALLGKINDAACIDIFALDMMNNERFYQSVLR